MNMAGRLIRHAKKREGVSLLNPDESQNKKSLTLVNKQTIWLPNRRLIGSYVIQ